MSSFRYTPEMDAKLVKLWESDLTLHEIANEMGVSRASIRDRTARLRAEGLIAPRRRLPERISEQARELAQIAGCPIDVAHFMTRYVGKDSESLPVLLLLWVEQEGRCWYTGAKMELALRGPRRVVVDFDGPDSRPVLCVREVQRMKGRFPRRAFLNVCSAVGQWTSRTQPLLQQTPR